MPKRQNNQPMGGQPAATPQLPPIPNEIRAQFPALRARYEQFRNLSDQQLWLYLLQLRQQQLQQQAMAQQQGRPMQQPQQMQQAPPQNNMSAMQARYGSGMTGMNNRKQFNGVSSGLFESDFFK